MSHFGFKLKIKVKFAPNGRPAGSGVMPERYTRNEGTSEIIPLATRAEIEAIYGGTLEDLGLRMGYTPAAEVSELDLDLLKGKVSDGLDNAERISREAFEAIENAKSDDGLEDKLNTGKNLFENAKQTAEKAKRIQNSVKAIARSKQVAAAGRAVVSALAPLAPWIAGILGVLLIGTTIFIATIYIICKRPEVRLLFPGIDQICKAFGFEDSGGNQTCPAGTTAYTKGPDGQWVANSSYQTSGTLGDVSSVGQGGVACLVAPKTGKLASPYWRALARAIKDRETRGIEASLKYTAFNGSCCWGAYQWNIAAPSAMDTARQVLGSIVPANPRSTSESVRNQLASTFPPVIQDQAFVAAWDAEARRRGLDTESILAGNNPNTIRNMFSRMCIQWQVACDWDEGSNLFKAYQIALAEEQAGSCGSAVAVAKSLKLAATENSAPTQKVIGSLAESLNSKQVAQLTKSIVELGRVNAYAAPGNFVYEEGLAEKIKGYIDNGKITDVIRLVSPRRGSLKEQIDAKQIEPNTLKGVAYIVESGKFNSIRITSVFRAGDNPASGHGSGQKIDIDAVNYKGSLYTHLQAYAGSAAAMSAFTELAHTIKDSGIAIHIISMGEMYNKLKADPYMLGIAIYSVAGHDNHYDIRFNPSGSVSSGFNSEAANNVLCCPAGVNPNNNADVTVLKLKPKKSEVFENPISIKVSAQESSSSSTSEASGPSTPNGSCFPASSQGNPSNPNTVSNAIGSTSLLQAARDGASGKNPQGYCYRAVKKYINQAGFGNFGGTNGNIYEQLGGFPQGEARNFAEFLNTGDNASKFGIRNLLDENPNLSPFNAPAGSIVVVSAGSPGTRHPTAGDISVADGNGNFYNDGEMSYRGADSWNGSQGKTGGRVLGIYVPVSI